HSRTEAIPNIVHYTYLKKDSSSTLDLTFQDFLSIYSASLYFKPRSILIHTDHNATYLKTAAKEGSRWTRKILTGFPNILKMNFVVPPTEANNMLIKNIEHKSDFVRWEQLYATGGIYLDWDVVALRDIALFRQIGFRNVVGRQYGGKVNPGLMMAEKESRMSYLMTRESPQVFDGEWETHSVDLLTHISQRLVRVENEVLILDEMAWAPTNWEAWSFDKLFGTHNEPQLVSDEEVIEDQEQDPIARWDNRRMRAEWEMDFSGTYLLHAFKSRGHNVEGFKGVSVKYVMQRNSNYGRAAYPVVKHMVDHGVVNETDD
ncbi:uncharacterized protein BDR25DRAFT_201736, partial [Lindgomyces ingoldianus]